MKRELDGPFYIQEVKTGRRSSFNYLMDIMLSSEQVGNVLSFDGAEDSETIEITKNAYNLALLRTFPQSKLEVQEIINYSNGKRIKLTLLEKLYIWYKG